MEIIRAATAVDMPRFNEIYNWTIEDNHVSFELEPWTDEKRLEWLEQRPPDMPTMVTELDGEVVGLSYGTPFRPKPAYRSSVETTIVLDTDHLGKGLGTRLLTAVIDELRSSGFHRAMALIALPNDGSVALHEKLGYRLVGTMTEVGFKLGRYWDGVLMEKAL